MGSGFKAEQKQIMTKKRAARIKNFNLTMLAVPGILLLFVFNYLPMCGIVLAFKDFNPNLGIFGSPWCGFDNFKFFFTSQDAKRTIVNTLGYSTLFLILDLIFAVALALMFYKLRSRTALKTYNTIVILPRFMSAVLIAFIVYLLLSPSYGIVNRILEALGLEPIAWYSEPKYWPWILTITHIWQTMGMNCIMQKKAVFVLCSSITMRL